MLSIYTKISIGCVIFIQNFGALFELSYIKAFYDDIIVGSMVRNIKVGNVNKDVNKDNAANEDNEDNKNKGYRFEFKITFLIKDT